MFASKIPVVAMILQSGAFALSVMIILLIFSVVSWSIIIAKWLHNIKEAKRNKEFLNTFGKYDHFLSWAEKEQPKGKCSGERIALAALDEYTRINDYFENSANRQQSEQLFGIQTEGIQSCMESTVAREIENADWGLTFLAVTSSVAPFMGLLGTVWGITHSFYEIGSMGSTSINIVAPGIAEALITTIAGLVVAIPCAIFYNMYVKNIRKLETESIHLAASLVSETKSLLLRHLH